MSSGKKKLGELLVDAKLITPEQLQAALVHQKQWGGRVGAVLVNIGYLAEDQLLAFLRNHFQVPSVNIKRVNIPEHVIKLIPEEVAKKYLLIPMGLKNINGKDTLIVAMSDPTNIQAIDEISFTSNHSIQPALALDFTIQQAIRHYYDKAGVFLEGASMDIEHPLMGSSPANEPVLDARELPGQESGGEAAPSSSEDIREDLQYLKTQLQFLARLLIGKGLLTEEELKEILRD